MAGKTNIEWAGHSWNPLAGCTVLTPGCKRCYAMRLAKRLGAMGQPLYKGLTIDTKAGAVWTGEMRKAPQHTLLDPLRRKIPTTYFVNSMSDLFHEGVPDEWIDEIFAVMALCPQHTFQVLTKRAARMQSYLSMARANPVGLEAFGITLEDHIHNPSSEVGKGTILQGDIIHLQKWPLPNVWLGVSAERQQEADERIPLLLNTPAAVRFISAEPLLGPIDLNRIHESGETQGGAHWQSWESAINGKRFDMWAGDDEDPMPPGHPKLDWVIVGGESGGGHRDMKPEWARDIRDQCIAAGVPVFVKQMSGRKPIPPDLQVRQFPENRNHRAITPTTTTRS